jgi:hypothetical protein
LVSTMFLHSFTNSGPRRVSASAGPVPYHVSKLFAHAGFLLDPFGLVRPC